MEDWSKYETKVTYYFVTGLFLFLKKDVLLPYAPAETNLIKWVTVNDFRIFHTI